MIFGKELSRARNEGQLPNENAVLSVSRSRIDGGPADGTRAIDVRVWKGIDLRILPDRGFDIGAAWFCGQSLAWISTVGETRPLDDLSGFAWSRGFGGGLMVTCGLRNVGMPSEGHGLHGTFSHLSADDVSVDQTIHDGASFVNAAAVITDAREPKLQLNRSIRTHARIGRIEVTDRITNLGSETAETPLLYHFNFGYPLWGPGALLTIPTTRTSPRDVASEAIADSWQLPPPAQRSEEHVLEHEVTATDGWGRVSISNETLGLTLSIGWRVAELPRLHQWINSSPGMYVLGIEPANCSTMGRAHDRSEGRLPVLEPGAVRETSLRIEAVNT